MGEGENMKIDSRNRNLMHENSAIFEGATATVFFLNGRILSGVLTTKVYGCYDSENFQTGICVDGQGFPWNSVATLRIDEHAIADIAKKMRDSRLRFVHYSNELEVNTGLPQEEFLKFVEQEIEKFVADKTKKLHEIEGLSK